MVALLPGVKLHVALCVAKHNSRPSRLIGRYRPASVVCRSRDNEHGSPLDDVEAMAEAQALYVQATKLATLETAMELETSWQSETASPGGYMRDPPPTESAVKALLEEYGLTQREAANLYKDMTAQQASTPDAPILSLSQLASRLLRWQRVLPGVNPARLAVSDVMLLYADIAAGLRALITLVSLMPGRDASSMIEKLPRLLWTNDLQSKLKVAKETLVRLHPSGDEDIVLDMIAEHPSLILRMGYYTNARMIDELPLEIQNMMVVADQSLAQTFRYYRNRRTNYKAELTSQDSMTSD